MLNIQSTFIPLYVQLLKIIIMWTAVFFVNDFASRDYVLHFKSKQSVVSLTLQYNRAPVSQVDPCYEVQWHTVERLQAFMKFNKDLVFNK